MGERGENLDFPTGAAVGVAFGVEGGFINNFESEGGGGGGCCCGVLDEEDGAHGAFAEDLKCF